MTKFDNIRDSLNEAIKKCFENEGRFINEEVLQWQKKFDSECLKYYHGK